MLKNKCFHKSLAALIIMLLAVSVGCSKESETVTEKQLEEVEQKIENKQSVNEKTAQSQYKEDKEEGENKETVIKEENEKAVQSQGEEPSSSNAMKSSTKDNSKGSSEETSEAKTTTTAKTTTATEFIAFQTIKRNDDSLEKGKEVVTQEGQNGVKTITYKETYQNGKLVSKDIISSKITKQPVDKIITVGTKKTNFTDINKARSILEGSPYMIRDGSNSYISLPEIDDHFAHVIIKNNKIDTIYFTASKYVTNSVSKQELIEILGKEEGELEYNHSQEILKKLTAITKTVAETVFEKNSPEYNLFYNELMKRIQHPTKGGSVSDEVKHTINIGGNEIHFRQYQTAIGVYLVKPQSLFY